MDSVLPMVICMMISLTGLVQTSEVEFNLLSRLLTNYDTSIRPVKKISMAVNMSMDFSLNQVIRLREKEQDVTLNIWMRWYWTDSNLVWNVSEYSGVDHLFIQPNRIWLPDITLYNSISSSDNGIPQHYNARVRHDGFVTFLFPAFIEASCKIDVTFFPFDIQRCVLRYGSWGYPGNALDVNPVNDKANTASFIQNGVWDLVEIPVSREVNYYICCPEPYPELKYTVILKRLPLYYMFNLLMPCIVITVLNLLVFLIPVESGEKISLNITVLLTMMVFLLIVAEIMPPQSEVVPVIGQYFGGCIFLLASSTVATVFVIHLHFRGNRGSRVPYILRKYVLSGLGRLLLYGKTLRMTGFLVNSQDQDVVQKNQVETSQNCVKEIKTEPFAHEQSEKEWQVVAMIVDRLFFTLHALGTIAITAYIFIYL